MTADHPTRSSDSPDHDCWATIDAELAEHEGDWDSPPRSPDSPDPEPTWQQPMADEPGGRRNPTYETECGECGSPLTVTNNYSPQGDFLDQSIAPRSPDSPDPQVMALADALVALDNTLDDSHPEGCDCQLCMAATDAGEAFRHIFGDVPPSGIVPPYSPPPRSSDSVRTPDLDVERLADAIDEHIETDCPRDTACDGSCAPLIEAIYSRLAALHPSLPGQLPGEEA